MPSTQKAKPVIVEMFNVESFTKENKTHNSTMQQATKNGKHKKILFQMRSKNTGQRTQEGKHTKKQKNMAYLNFTTAK